MCSHEVMDVAAPLSGSHCTADAEEPTFYAAVLIVDGFGAHNVTSGAT